MYFLHPLILLILFLYLFVNYNLQFILQNSDNFLFVFKKFCYQYFNSPYRTIYFFRRGIRSTKKVDIFLKVKDWNEIMLYSYVFIYLLCK